MLEKAKSKVHENRKILAAVAPALIVGALFLASELGLVASLILALAGIVQMLSQITDDKEDKLVVVGGAILFSSFLLNNLIGKEAQSVALTLSISMMIFSLSRKSQS
jgi:sugar phosphate permease